MYINLIRIQRIRIPKRKDFFSLRNERIVFISQVKRVCIENLKRYNIEKEEKYRGEDRFYRKKIG